MKTWHERAVALGCVDAPIQLDALALCPSRIERLLRAARPSRQPHELQAFQHIVQSLFGPILPPWTLFCEFMQAGLALDPHPDTEAALGALLDAFVTVQQRQTKRRIVFMAVAKCLPAILPLAASPALRASVTRLVSTLWEATHLRECIADMYSVRGVEDPALQWLLREVSAPATPTAKRQRTTPSASTTTSGTYHRVLYDTILSKLTPNAVSGLPVLLDTLLTAQDAAETVARSRDPGQRRNKDDGKEDDEQQRFPAVVLKRRSALRASRATARMRVATDLFLFLHALATKHVPVPVHAVRDMYQALVKADAYRPARDRDGTVRRLLTTRLVVTVVPMMTSREASAVWQKYVPQRPWIPYTRVSTADRAATCHLLLAAMQLEVELVQPLLPLVWPWLWHVWDDLGDARAEAQQLVIEVVRMWARLRRVDALFVSVMEAAQDALCVPETAIIPLSLNAMVSNGDEAVVEGAVAGMTARQAHATLCALLNTIDDSRHTYKAYVDLWVEQVTLCVRALVLDDSAVAGPLRAACLGIVSLLRQLGLGTALTSMATSAYPDASFASMLTLFTATQCLLVECDQVLNARGDGIVDDDNVTWCARLTSREPHPSPPPFLAWLDVSEDATAALWSKARMGTHHVWDKALVGACRVAMANFDVAYKLQRGKVTWDGKPMAQLLVAKATCAELCACIEWIVAYAPSEVETCWRRILQQETVVADDVARMGTSPALWESFRMVWLMLVHEALSRDRSRLTPLRIALAALPPSCADASILETVVAVDAKMESDRDCALWRTVLCNLVRDHRLTWASLKTLLARPLAGRTLAATVPLVRSVGLVHAPMVVPWLNARWKADAPSFLLSAAMLRAAGDTPVVAALATRMGASLASLQGAALVRYDGAALDAIASILHWCFGHTRRGHRAGVQAVAAVERVLAYADTDDALWAPIVACPLFVAMLEATCTFNLQFPSAQVTMSSLLVVVLRAEEPMEGAANALVASWDASNFCNNMLAVLEAVAASLIQATPTAGWAALDLLRRGVSRLRDPSCPRTMATAFSQTVAPRLLQGCCMAVSVLAARVGATRAVSEAANAMTLSLNICVSIPHACVSLVYGTVAPMMALLRRRAGSDASRLFASVYALLLGLLMRVSWSTQKYRAALVHHQAGLFWSCVGDLLEWVVSPRVVGGEVANEPVVQTWTRFVSRLVSTAANTEAHRLAFASYVPGVLARYVEAYASSLRDARHEGMWAMHDEAMRPGVGALVKACAALSVREVERAGLQWAHAQVSSVAARAVLARWVSSVETTESNG